MVKIILTDGSKWLYKMCATHATSYCHLLTIGSSNHMPLVLDLYIPLHASEFFQHDILHHNDPVGNQGPSLTHVLTALSNSLAFPLVNGIVTSPAGTLGSAITQSYPVHVNTFRLVTSTYAGVGCTLHSLFIVRHY